jgi:hypothetical protein
LALVIAVVWGLIVLALLALFAIAAVIEFRATHKRPGLILRIAESTFGVVAAVALSSRFWGITGLSPARLSWTMLFALLLTSGLSLLSKYSSRFALSLVLLGNGILAFFWYHNGAYHDVIDDRTASIDWAYQWDIDDPIGRITEKFRPGSVPKHGAIYFRPAIGQNGTIYLLRPHEYTDPRGLSLAAFDPNWLWEIRPEGGICTLPVIADDGTILFGTGADDGTIHRGFLYAGKGRAWAISAEGKKKWTYEFPPASLFHTRGYGVDPADSSPACNQPAVAADGTSYWSGHGVYALTSDGALRWAFDPGEDFDSVCIADDGTVYALANDALFALAPDGAQKWKYPFEKSEFFSGELALGNEGTIYLTIKNTILSTALLALTPQGTLKWRNQKYVFAGNALVASDGTIFENVRVGTNTAVVALDSDGKPKWNTPEASYLLDLASDGTVYVCYVRDLFAISPRGKMLWKVRLPENPDSLEAHDPTKAVTLVPRGKFYIGDFLGRLGTLGVPAGLPASGWPSRFHDARNTARAGAH